MKYEVTLYLSNDKDLLDFLASVGSVDLKIVSHELTEIVHMPAPAPAPVKRRSGPRGSKVSDAILSALPATTKELRQALMNVGLSPGSVAHGLATLQAAGRIERVDTGHYVLSVAQAAE